VLGGSWEREGCLGFVAHPWLALFFLHVAGKLIVMEVSSSWRGKNACAGQFLVVRPTLGVDFGNIVVSTTHANVRLHC
jgi:hypothetical protein